MKNFKMLWFQIIFPDDKIFKDRRSSSKTRKNNQAQCRPNKYKKMLIPGSTRSSSGCSVSAAEPELIKLTARGIHIPYPCFEKVRASVADRWHFGTDPDPRLWLMDPDPDPAISFVELQDANKKLFFSAYYFLKVHLHYFSKKKSHKEVKKQ